MDNNNHNNLVMDAFSFSFQLNSWKWQRKITASLLLCFILLWFRVVLMYHSSLNSSSKAFMVSHPSSPMGSTVGVYPMKVVKFLTGPTTFLHFKSKQERLARTRDMFLQLWGRLYKKVQKFYVKYAFRHLNFTRPWKFFQSTQTRRWRNLCLENGHVP